MQIQHYNSINFSSDIKFLIDMSEHNIYPKIKNLRDKIEIIDTVIEKYNSTNYLELSNITYFHQMIEFMIDSLLEQEILCTRLSLYPKEITIKNNPKTFYQKINRLKNSNYNFENKDNFIDLSIEYNRLRNLIMHSFFDIAKNKYPLFLEQVSSNYNTLKDIYIKTSVKCYNFINEEIHKFNKYLISDFYYMSDIVLLKNYYEVHYSEVYNYITPYSCELLEYLVNNKTIIR